MPEVTPETLARLHRATGELARDAVGALAESYGWFRDMPPAQRATVGLLVQAGINAFTDWVRRPAAQPDVVGRVFDMAPPEMARAITLQQTVDLVRVAVNTVEARLAGFADGAELAELRAAVLLFSREIGFAVASVYARAAEQRGAWDARHESVVVDALVRGQLDEEASSAAAALGWPTASPVTVFAVAAAGGSGEQVLAAARRAAHREGLPALGGVQEDRVLLLAGTADPVGSGQRLFADHLDRGGTVVAGPAVASLSAAVESAAAALAGLRATPAWPDAPGLRTAAELLPERALAGDRAARSALAGDVYAPLAAAGGDLLDTVSCFLEHGGSVEGTARALFVHPNTVRYRLRRVARVTGVHPGSPRGAFTLRLALALGRLAAARPANRASPDPSQVL